MRFAEPQILNFLFFLIPLVYFLFWARQRRAKRLSQFVDTPLWPAVAPLAAKRKEGRRAIWILSVYALGVIAWARPQWGFEWQEVKREGVDILLAVDVSKSMLTADVRPNRLERTKLAIRDVLKKLHGDRVGLIAFAGDAFLVCPLTADYSGFLLNLDDLSPDSVPRGGTDISAAIQEAVRVESKTQSKYKVLVIATDGDDLEGDALAAARKAKEKGIAIYCVGIGTAEGDLIQVTDDQGAKSFLKDGNENFIKSRLNENLLQKIALETGGVYARMGGAQSGIEQIYDQYLSKQEKTESDQRMEKIYFERFQIPLLLAFALLIGESLI
ncbi:MAG: VWA domain-containing protein [Candidatus Omnitrophica bacterium]|nr:VWA domain-containing protein [Candidatus Omnitrophota bacterium]